MRRCSRKLSAEAAEREEESQPFSELKPLEDVDVHSEVVVVVVEVEVAAMVVGVAAGSREDISC